MRCCIKKCKMSVPKTFLKKSYGIDNKAFMVIIGNINNPLGKPFDILLSSSIILFVNYTKGEMGMKKIIYVIDDW